MIRIEAPHPPRCKFRVLKILSVHLETLPIKMVNLRHVGSVEVWGFELRSIIPLLLSYAYIGVQ